MTSTAKQWYKSHRHLFGKRPYDLPGLGSYTADELQQSHQFARVRCWWRGWQYLRHTLRSQQGAMVDGASRLTKRKLACGSGFARA